MRSLVDGSTNDKPLRVYTKLKIEVPVNQNTPDTSRIFRADHSELIRVSVDDAV